MRAIMLISCLALLVCVQAAVTGPEARSGGDSKDQQLATASVGILDSVLRGKSRQSRCVRCYEDRDRDRYYSGYSSRTGDDARGSAWYYSGYDDRSRDRDYDRYYDRSRYYEDRYTPRTYDRYEGRGYDDYRRGSAYGGSYDRERGYGYDNRDRYYSGDRYSEGSSRDRYYDRSRTGGYDRYDPYDRYYSRYDFRNYRPWDETYRGQSGFDNSGRGYYFATDEDESDRSRGSGYSYSRPSSSMSSPCGRISGNCPYASGFKVTSPAIGSDSSRVGGHTNALGSEGGPGSWTYLGDQDKAGGSSSGSGGGSSSSSASSSSSGSSGSGSGSGGSRERERDRERDAQSSSYGGRPRPLGVSYLLERDADTPSDGPGNTANAAGNGGSNGGGAAGQSMPIPAAQTAAEGSSGAAEQ
ncbi:keratin, type I cytoskeletal 9 isoform X1 [Drosophila santomea]|uniref:keratin, type I cytoskeletal 9 isoform X1 n=1 Tax=Drosophila santomea TaxID=129105 RepID=UPI001952CE7B|nr:keratin, type I cytoskeletal 9 isoform X1 [Drosophila santomea]